MDDEIEQRLRGLDDIVNDMVRKQKSKELQKEIELRLAKLNERDPNFYSGKEPPVKLLSIKQRSAVEEADDLIKKFMEEVKLDEKSMQEKSLADHELEERLQKLAKAQAELNLTTGGNKKKVNPKLKKFKQTGELIHQLMMRSTEIRERNEQAADDNDVDVTETDAIDWCSTCNEDGVVQCIDCDNDIFCKDCFRELHRDSDMREHHTQPYKTKSRI